MPSQCTPKGRNENIGLLTLFLLVRHITWTVEPSNHVGELSGACARAAAATSESTEAPARCDDWATLFIFFFDVTMRDKSGVCSCHGGAPCRRAAARANCMTSVGLQFKLCRVRVQVATGI